MHAPQRSRLVFGASLALASAAITLIALDLTVPAVVLIVLACAANAAAWWRRPSATAAPPDTEDLIARLSHELRTPLTSVLGLLDVLDGDHVAIESEERAELFGLAKSEALQLEHLVDNLHSASRLARDVLETHPQPIDLAHLASRVVDRFPAVARRTYMPSSDLRAHADPRLAMQIVTNLVQNVDRYAPEGEISVAIERRGDHVALVVSDDGPGISEADRAFERSASRQGMGIGLSLSRELAEAMGGRLELEPPRRRGATFTLLLPFTELDPTPEHDQADRTSGPVVAHSPRARLLVDLAAAFAERSLDRTMAGIHRLYVDLLGATGTVLMIPDGEAFHPISGAGTTNGRWVADATLSHVLRSKSAVELTGIAEPGVPAWQRELEGRAALAVPVIDGNDAVGVLVVAFDKPNAIPAGRAGQVAFALAHLAAFAVHRSELAKDVAFERTLRSSVMESLPIAISVFAGDPPKLVDWNQRERDMLGLTDGIRRPSDLDATQSMFDVRFADGTPLTVDNAPVTEAIRTGGSTGPFLLSVRRADGSEITTRTYCAPFFSDDGTVAGAVVTSEELDVAKPGRPANLAHSPRH